MLSNEHSTSTPAASLQDWDGRPTCSSRQNTNSSTQNLIESKYAVNCRWFWREINQPINQSSQMPPAPTPIQATVRSPHRRAIQKAVRCHAAEQFNLIRATDLILIAIISLWRCENFNSELQTKKRDYNRRCTDDLLEALDEMLVLHQLRQKRSNQDPFPTYVIN